MLPGLLRQYLLDALSHGGNVVIPTFALERAQEILYFLKAAADAGKLPSSMRVFLDSPHAVFRAGTAP